MGEQPRGEVKELSGNGVRPITSPSQSPSGAQARWDLLFVAAASLAWVYLSLRLSFAWPLALIGLAYVALNARLISFSLFEIPPRRRRIADFPDLTLIVATYNDEDLIEETLESAAGQDYPGELRILVADADSTDETVERASAWAEHDLRISVHRFPHDAKARTIRRALTTVGSPLVATIDAGTLLGARALRLCASQLLVSAVSTVAVGGTVFVSTARENLLAQAEEWDHHLGVAPARQPQDELRGPLMVPDDFRVYRTRTARELAGQTSL